MKRIIAAIFALMFVFIGCSHTDEVYTFKTYTIAPTDPGNWEYDAETKTITLTGSGVWEGGNLAPGKEANTLIISDGITYVYDPIDLYRFDVVKIGKDLEGIDLSGNPKVSFKVDPENQYFATYGDCLYSKNYDTLFCTPARMASIRIHPNTKTIKENAISASDMRTPIVVPKGVTTIEYCAFYSVPENTPIVLPDTITYMDTQEIPRYYAYNTFFYSKNNTVADKVSKRGGKLKPELLPYDMKNVKSIEDIYKITNNGQTLKNALWVRIDTVDRTNLPENVTWVEPKYDTYYYEEGVMVKGFKRIGGKASFFGPNGLMQKDKWIRHDGNWYYLNSYGAGVVKYWIEENGKWYYLQEDGTMATNKWIKWYNKWYYVGKDGAMYANRKTPDGYYVNASGVWVK